MERPSVSKRVYVQHEPESLTLLDECFICSPPKRARNLDSSSHEGETCNFVVKCRESQAFNRLLGIYLVTVSISKFTMFRHLKSLLCILINALVASVKRSLNSIWLPVYTQFRISLLTAPP